MTLIKLSIASLTIVCGMMYNSHAVSFDCSKATTLVESLICSDDRLSQLDDLLNESYKKTISNNSQKAKLKSEQLSWMKNIRNKCKSYECLAASYEERINALTSSNPLKKADKNIVNGRCHMDVCWWWKIEKTERIKSNGESTLTKLLVRSSEEISFPNGNYPPNGFIPIEIDKTWNKVDEVFIFCSSKLPTYISINEEKKKFIGIVPFSEDGIAPGVHEGIGNLYSHICHAGKEPIIQLDSSVALKEMELSDPVDIFRY